MQMPYTDELSIESWYHARQVIVGATGSRHILFSCDVCGATVQSGHRRSHLEWHQATRTFLP